MTAIRPYDLAPPKRQRKPRTVPHVERCTMPQAMAILGLKNRKVADMAQRGEIPGAAKLRRQWTFDLAKLRCFVTQQEQACHASERPRPDVTGAVIRSGAALRFAANGSGGRLKQAIQRLRKRASKRDGAD